MTQKLCDLSKTVITKYLKMISKVERETAKLPLYLTNNLKNTHKKACIQ